MHFNTQNLRNLIAKGELKEAIISLAAYAGQYLFPFNKEIYALSSRYHSVEKDHMRRTIGQEDYSIEVNSITHHLLEILDMIDQLDQNKVQPFESIDPRESIQELHEAFEESRKIKSKASRLRTKNHLSRQIGEIFLQFPALIPEYMGTSSDGIIGGICRKIIYSPAYSEIEVLSHLVSKTDSLFVKGEMINALAEIIYNGKLGLGDEEIAQQIFQEVEKKADLPLQKNVERVRVALEYLTNTGSFDKSEIDQGIIDSQKYALDDRIRSTAEKINTVYKKGPFFKASDLIEQIDKLFNRMTFRGEPDISLCRSQRWTQRVHSALMTHHFLLQLEPHFFQLATQRQNEVYQQLLLSISQYIDAMIAYLFQSRKIDVDEIKGLIGTSDFATQFKKNEEVIFEEAPNEEGIIMEERIRSTINKYLQRTINLANQLSESHL